MMVAAIGFLSSMNLFIKMIRPKFRPIQVAFIRNLIATIIILPFIVKVHGVGILRTKRPWGHAAPALGGVAGNACYVYAFARLPLANGMVIS